MIYKKHIEYQKNEIDTHPQTGESKAITIIDAYFHDDHVVLWGWGTYDKLKPIPSDELDKLMIDEGFTKAWEDGYDSNGNKYEINYMEESR